MNFAIMLATKQSAFMKFASLLVRRDSGIASTHPAPTAAHMESTS
jgi:hypothetical protein